MAGTLTIDTLKATTGSLATQNGMTGIAKAWALFAGTASSGSASIYGSYNISSITIASAGYFTVNFTTAMANINYAVTGNASGTSGTDPFVTVELFMNGGSTGTLTAPTTSAFTISTGLPVYGNKTPYYVSIVVHGN
jgi:hypothetical protein